ncbi:unnamed protein product [Dimorphilus gyrociliatus]|uniref:Uncharacterized protein n=1 Tax=Dimorphilus gyrociliatus TaxID=2664684 RepID=A0A7I8VKK5_9ANNE|nr:unnamed protein product [Dimorphilus gyrociliatus]
MEGTNASINLVICSYTMLILYVLFGIYILPLLLSFKVGKQSRTLINCSTVNSQDLIMKESTDKGNDRQTVKPLEKTINFSAFSILPVIYVCLLCGTISLQYVMYSVYRTPEILRPQVLNLDHPLMNYKRISGEFDSIGSYLNMTIVVDLGSDDSISWDFIEWASNSCNALKMNNYTTTVWKVRRCFMKELYTDIKQQCNNSNKYCQTREMIGNLSLAVIKRYPHKYLFMDHLLTDNTERGRNFYVLNLQLDYLIQSSFVEEECLRQNMIYEWNILRLAMPSNYPTTVHFPDFGFGVRRSLSWQPLASALLQLFSGTTASFFLKIDLRTGLIMVISILLASFSSIGLMLLMNNLITVLHVMAMPYMITIVCILHLLTLTVVVQFKGEQRVTRVLSAYKSVTNPSVTMIGTMSLITLFFSLTDSTQYIYSLFQIALITIIVAWIFIYCFFLPFINISSMPPSSLRDNLLRNKLSDVVSSEKSLAIPSNKDDEKEGKGKCINALSGDVISIIKGKRRKVGVYNLQIGGDMLIEPQDSIKEKENIDKQTTHIRIDPSDNDNKRRQNNSNNPRIFTDKIKSDLLTTGKDSDFIKRLTQALNDLKSKTDNGTKKVTDKEKKKDTFILKRRGTLERIAEEDWTGTNSSRPLNTSTLSLLSDPPEQPSPIAKQTFLGVKGKVRAHTRHSLLKRTTDSVSEMNDSDTNNDSYSMKAEKISPNSQSQTTVVSSWSTDHLEDANMALDKTESIM